MPEIAAHRARLERRARIDLTWAAIALGCALLLLACITPTDAAERVTLPVSDHALRHVCVVGLLVGAAALVAAAIGRRARP